MDIWNPWTTKSRDIGFKSKTKGIGDGEEKLGKELDTEPLGQNISHDLKVGNQKWEVKKLDKDSSFRLGVSVSSRYNNLLFKVISCFYSLNGIKDALVSEFYKKKINKILNDANSQWGRSKTSILDGLLKNEVSEANLDKLNELLEDLKEVIYFDYQTMNLFSSYDGKNYEYSSIDVVKKLNLEDIKLERKLAIFESDDLYDQNFISACISEELKVLKYVTFKEKLNDIIRGVFNDLVLVVVDTNKGFMPISSIESIFCYRITSGTPRCKILTPG